MVFIDNLAFGLFAITIAGLMLLYSTVSVYFSYKENKKTLSNNIKDITIPLFFIGAYLLIAGLWGGFTWPLPGAYNILFYDPMMAFGIVMLAFATTGRLGGNLEHAGFLALLAGVMVIIYGIEGYSVGLTLSPIALLGMFLFYGFAGILAYPSTIIGQRSIVSQKNIPTLWFAILILFCLSLLAASAIAGYIGFEAVSGHLANPP